MRYYKLIDNNTIIGVVASNDFMQYSPYADCYLRSNEQTGEFVSYKGKFYRSDWMTPPQVTLDFQEINIINISEEEYYTLQQAFKTQTQIEIEDEEEEEQENIPVLPIDPNEQLTLEFIRSSKISDMSKACRAAIEDGFDLAIRGETYHFSLTMQDQLNLMSLSTMIQTEQLIPYHADGEMCEFYTADEINQIITAATKFKNYNTAYYNSLKAYISSLETIEEISAITYGTSIPEEYKSDVLKVLEY